MVSQLKYNISIIFIATKQRPPMITEFDPVNDEAVTIRGFRFKKQMLSCEKVVWVYDTVN